MSKTQQRDDEVIRSSGNVFADLGLASAPEDMLKAEMGLAIARSIQKRNLTQAAVGKLIGVDQAKVSALLRGRLTGFSVERLVSFLLKLGHDINITISCGHIDRGGQIAFRHRNHAN